MTASTIPASPWRTHTSPRLIAVAAIVTASSVLWTLAGPEERARVPELPVPIEVAAPEPPTIAEPMSQDPVPLVRTVIAKRITTSSATSAPRSITRKAEPTSTRATPAGATKSESSAPAECDLGPC